MIPKPTEGRIFKLLDIAKSMMEKPFGSLPASVSPTPEAAKEFAKSVKVSKAWETADIASAGAMPPGYARRFLDTVIHGSPLLSQCTVIMMREDKRHVDRMGFTGRVLRPATEGEEPGTESKPATARVTLDVEEFAGKVDMNYSTLEDVIEAAGEEALRIGLGQGNENFDRFVALGVVEAILRRLAPALRRDIEYYALLSDTAFGSGDLSKFNGWLKSAGNSYDHSGYTDPKINDVLFLKTLLALPAEHRADKSMLKFFAGSNTEIYWRHYLGKNAGGGLANAALGDRGHRDIPGLQGPNGTFGAYGVPMETVTQLPEAETTSEDQGRFLLGNPQQLVLGVKRNLTVESERLTGKRQVRLIPQIRFDAKIVDPTSVAVGKSYTVDVAA